MNKDSAYCSGKQRSGALHLTQKVDYGIMLLTALAKSLENETISLQKIAKENNISFAFLQKIARLLNQAGLIKASRGKFGGYLLAKTANALSIKEIIEALEGEIAIVPCLKKSQDEKCKHSSYCKVRHSFQKINQEIQAHILTKKLSYFI